MTLTLFDVLDQGQQWFVSNAQKLQMAATTEMAGKAQMAAVTAVATAGLGVKMAVATAETAAMMVVGRKEMVLMVAKAAAMAAMDCRGGRDASKGRNSSNRSSGDAVDRSRNGSIKGSSNGRDGHN